MSLTIKLIVETLTRQKRVGSTRSIAVGIRDKMAVGFSQITKKRASSFSFLGWDVILQGIRPNQYYLVWNNTNGSPGDILQKDLIITYQPRSEQDYCIYDAVVYVNAQVRKHFVS